MKLFPYQEKVEDKYYRKLLEDNWVNGKYSYFKKILSQMKKEL